MAPPPDGSSATLALDRGALCISIDLELMWGVWDHQTEQGHQLCALHERDITRRLLELFQRHDTPATWAIVGRLLEEGDARSRRGGVQNWFAPDVVDAVRKAKPTHEIGSHSYAHVYYPTIPAAEVAADLDAARRAHLAAGLEFRSFVFPRNMVAHEDLLSAAGLKVYRTLDQGPLHRLGRTLPALRSASNLADKLLPTAPLPIFPKRKPGGLVELESSLLLIGRNGARRAIHPLLFAHKLKAGLDAAVRERGVFHLWFHPSNFYFEPETQYALLDGLLRDAAALRAAGTLDVRTMGSFAV